VAFWRRIWGHEEESAIGACTALDIGTEFVKALVFEIDEDGMGTVRGVGRKRQGLAHMQSGTVTDINAVVDNCSVALQEAEVSSSRVSPPRTRRNASIPTPRSRMRSFRS